MAISYRRDVDGLRAVAVLAVVIYHLGLPFSFDGYIGVDVFFVISGYLITGILYKDILARRFSLVSFYIRRIKRILPALYFVLLFAIAVGSLILLPSDVKSLGKAAFSAVMSASNIYFWYSEDASYFARSSELLPLLHTWSLGVEEQFYLVWPVVLFFACSLLRRHYVLLGTVVLAIISFAYSEYLVRTDASFAYYMLPSRAGELLIGAVAFLIATGRRPSTRYDSVLELAAALGAGLVIYSLFFVDNASGFPGINAVYPCLGIGLVLISGAWRQTLVSRFLGLSPFVMVGLVSYSLYLWHWPILAYARYLYTSLDPVSIAYCIVGMSAASVFSYRYIERPFREFDITPKSVFILYLAIPAMLFVPVTLYLYQTDGLKRLLEQSESYQSVASDRERYTKPAFQYSYVCQTKQHSLATLEGPDCLIGAEDRPPRVLLWGDSHAAHHVGYLAEIARAGDFTIRNLELGNCPPTLFGRIDFIDKSTRDECTAFRTEIRRRFENYDIVVMGGIWANYLKHRGFEADLVKSLDFITSRGVQVVLLGQIPRFENYDRNCLLRNERFLDINCVERANSQVVRYEADNSRLRALAATSDLIQYMDLSEFICDDQCSPYRNGIPLYFDRGHLSIYGSHWLGKAWPSPFKHLFAKVAYTNPGTVGVIR